MTIVVTVRVNDGIVLAGDSATTFMDANGVPVKVYNNANKIFNLVKGRPIGAMTYGSGSIGKASISTLSKDFRVLLGKKESPYWVDLGDYKLEDVADKAKRFFSDTFRIAYPTGVPQFFMGYRVCGYSANGTLPEAYEVRITEKGTEGPDPIYDADGFGPRWAGETEAIDRLVLGLGSRGAEALMQMGLNQPEALSVASDLRSRLYAGLSLPAMPIQDAIDLARFLADTAAKFAQFSLRAPTVGGPIETATITKHEGFKWVTRKHYYSAEYNRETDHVA